MWLKITPSAVRIALQDALVCLLAYLAGFYFTRALYGAEMRIGALWSVISGLVVLQATRRDTVAKAWLRVLGTLIGCIISTIYLLILPFSPVGMAVCVGITVLLCHVCRVPDHARLATITVAVIMVLAATYPGMNPLANAGLRFGESCLGTTMAVLAVLAWPEGNKVR